MEIENKFWTRTIPKGRGDFRTIYIPSDSYKKELRIHLPYLLERLLKLDKNQSCHAFVKGRNCVTNALQHLSYRHTISLDLKDFFNSIRPAHVSGKISNEVIKECFIDNAPRQGLPTSPLIANIALVDCDERIIAQMENQLIRFSYTRYADDICISVDDEKAISKIKFIVSNVLESQGFKLNARKTRIQHQRNGRRIITGVGVDNEGIFPTRKTKKKIRAAMHQDNKASFVGLSEWSTCKLPGHAKLKGKLLVRQAESTKPIACKYCKEEGLLWYIEDGYRKILVGCKSGLKHVCPQLPTPISCEDLKVKLRLLEFEEFQPQSNTWSIGYFSSENSGSLFVLFRKGGIDLGVHNCSHRIEADPSGLVSMHSDKITRRYSYSNTSDNVHALVMDEVNKYFKKKLAL